MNQYRNGKLSENARTLRKNMTKEERRLWYDFLKELPVMVHRQKVIGRYIVDFYIAKANLIIELDGSQHYDIQGIQSDLERDAYLRSQGLNILRYANSDIHRNFDGVCQDIWNHLMQERIAQSLLLEEKVPRRGGCGVQQVDTSSPKADVER